MSNDLVAYSRAGDVFHYRWAARRCLHLIYPNSKLTEIAVEGSAESQMEGEYVIDVAEYYLDAVNKRIDYYQLKHTTVRQDQHFTLSNFKDTFEGFSRRFVQHRQQSPGPASVSFTILTNRKISDNFKTNISDIAAGMSAEPDFIRVLTSYVNLAPDELKLFCQSLRFEDSEGDYNVQKQELRAEIAQLVAGSIDNAQITNLIELVVEKVLPHTNNKITREDVLKRFGITSERDLYPAPPELGKLENVIVRAQHAGVITDILASPYTRIIHAPGGVGKTVFCQQFIEFLPKGSLGIIYDCFGSGKYRNPSGPRHRHRDALVQIGNELAAKGLCDPILIQDSTLDEKIIRMFLDRLRVACTSLRKLTSDAQLIIIVDAADNAEMAAAELGTRCFARELLREQMPEGCKLVMLCRPERINLLQPPSSVVTSELHPFSGIETTEHLRKWFAQASDYDGTEFHRLTGGNPRVQANALHASYATVSDLLSSLGPAGTTVEAQIEMQLKAAVSKIKDLYPSDFYDPIESICLGLASLSPYIPITVLAEAAGVQAAHVRSFVADIGRALWISDSSVQFRDEPTETWFRKTYLAQTSDYEKYIVRLEPLATTSSYVAEVLPQLYLQAGQYPKLIEIALSDRYLPENNPIDARTIRVYRLQFAFKAALRSRQYKDAIQLAMRAGEEVAGNQRQLSLLKGNIDLITTLQSNEKVQEFAFKRMLASGWIGSENIYSASLLSSIPDYHGEARGYLRAAQNWLRLYFEEVDARPDRNHHDDLLNDRDILEMAYAALNIQGVVACVRFISGFKQTEAIYRVISLLIRRLVDLGRFAEVDQLAERAKTQVYFVLALNDELQKIGRRPERSVVASCLILLCSKRTRIDKTNPDRINSSLNSAIASLVESCCFYKLEENEILRVLNHYIPIQASHSVGSRHFGEQRTEYLRAMAIRSLFSRQAVLDFDSMLPSNLKRDKPDHHIGSQIKEFKEVVSALFPYFQLLAKLIFDPDLNVVNEIDKVIEESRKVRQHRYSSRDMIPREISSVLSTILILNGKAEPASIGLFYDRLLATDQDFNVYGRLNLLRAAYRAAHLAELKDRLETSTHKSVEDMQEDEVEMISGRYISLCRAVLISSPNDAAAYFDEAITIASKFGDEIVDRWEAVVSLGERAAANGGTSNELAYRFIRCAEAVGTLSREKHWDRAGAMAVCAQMSPGIAFAALSRMRDRHVARFELQLKSLLSTLLGTGKISAAMGWAMIRFLETHYEPGFLSLCLDATASSEVKEAILSDAVRLLQLEGATAECWLKIHKIAVDHNLNNDGLDAIISAVKRPQPTTEQDRKDEQMSDTTVELKWDDVFLQDDIASIAGFQRIFARFRNRPKAPNWTQTTHVLLSQCLFRLPEARIPDFLDVLLENEWIGRYDFQQFVETIPQAWRTRAGFRRLWPGLLIKAGRRFAPDLAIRYGFRSFSESILVDAQEIDKLKEGVVSGLADGFDLASADMFFGFSTMASTLVSAQQAAELLDFSVSRFEIHINDSLGDGPWQYWLDVPDDVNNAVGGFLWSALGSPRATERWNAVHCVRMLAEFKCEAVFDALVGWFESDGAGAFGARSYSFYSLHARLYALVAFSRISLTLPAMLMKHSQLFVLYALKYTHVLVQYYAGKTIENIEKFAPGTYAPNVLEAVRNLGVGSLSDHEVAYSFQTDSFWHQSGNIDGTLEYNFAWDFDQYWFAPLGRVFGVPMNQIEELATEVIRKDWRAGHSGNYNDDPRRDLWNRASNERETGHDKSGYPQTDDLSFYFSYHALMVVAAKLIRQMPILLRNDGCENPWQDWLADHLLSLPDGKWLADHRGPVPLNRPEWVLNENMDRMVWKSSIKEGDFLAILKDSGSGDSLDVVVKGGWSERKREKIESFRISSALVSKETSNALMMALANCSDPSDFKLPDYDEDNMEIDSESFFLKGWIDDWSASKGPYENDPYAEELAFPPFSLGKSYRDRLNLVEEPDGYSTRHNESNQVVLRCDTWSSEKSDRDEHPDQEGMVLRANLDFLRQLCATVDCDIIFEVSIQRDVRFKYNEGQNEYSRGQNRIFILSQDGEFRTTETN
ncbi:hypothetical protein [Dawidia soli]|uniref:ATP-binding protein n=1 Tax=Dawidia soli TaxID=2782352 RepID=A0AAP2DJJ5_9BACT|nr:hypothetical protein [Dawidia soli]MBT1690657.1 hypothetical protein [Dawidia soli]